MTLERGGQYGRPGCRAEIRAERAQRERAVALYQRKDGTARRNQRLYNLASGRVRPAANEVDLARTLKEIERMSYEEVYDLVVVPIILGLNELWGRTTPAA